MKGGIAVLSDCSSFCVDQSNQEQQKHGTAAFPAACYLDDLEQSSVSWHWHEELEVIVVAEGEALVVVGTRTYIVRAGDGLLISTGTLHSCQAEPGSGCRLHSLVFHPRLVGGSMESIFYQKYVLPVTENLAGDGIFFHMDMPWQAEALLAAEAAWQAGVQEPACYELRMRSCLSELLAAVCAHLPANRTAPNAKSLRKEKRIKQMLRFIQEHYAEELNTASIAAAASISESECLRCFHAVIKTTPIQYLREYRMERAARFLSEGSDHITEIAARCGFQDVSYFTKTFRRLKGCTPKEYRQTHPPAARPPHLLTEPLNADRKILAKA